MGGMLGGMGLPRVCFHDARLRRTPGSSHRRICSSLPASAQKSAQRIASTSCGPGRPDAELSPKPCSTSRKAGFVPLCNNISDSDVCLYCRDAGRDPTVVCVVRRSPPTSVGIEPRASTKPLPRAHGALSPLRGIGPNRQDHRAGGAHRPG